MATVIINSISVKPRCAATARVGKEGCAHGGVILFDVCILGVAEGQPANDA